MSTIIKAADHNRAVQSIAFNLDDVRGGAEQYLTKIREQAGQLLLEAKRESDAIRARAEQEGRRAGEAAIDLKVEQQMRAALSTLLPALQESVRQIEQSHSSWLAHWEQQAVHLATKIAERIIRRELRSDPHLALPVVRETLEIASHGGRIRLLLNPQDHATLGREIERLIRELSRLGPAEVIADPSIALGGCRVETQHGSIDQQIETQLQRIEQELT